MDESYDIIVLGTGITECILSGILSMEGKRVLHLDRNNYYGGECASLKLSELFKLYKGVALTEAEGRQLGRDRDYNIDLVPKFAMAAGEFVSILVHTDVTRYVEFQQVAGSYVYREGKGIAKVPSTQTEAIMSSLIGFWEKNRARTFFEYLQGADPDEPSTWQGFDLDRQTMLQLYQKFGLEEGIQDFIGHSLALHLDDAYLQEPALETCRRIRLYMESMARFGKSPYVYPLYGLGELPQGFARLSAIYGGTYMLSQPVDEILFGEDGRVCGVRSGQQVAKAPVIIADPSYAKQHCRLSHQVIRTICILNHPIPKTNDSDSCQIIIPQRQLHRKCDVDIACVSHHHNVAPDGIWLATVSTIIETGEPEKEVEPGLSLLGPILEKVSIISDLYTPKEDGRKTGLFLSKSLDATSHFETVCADVKDLYKRIMGRDLKLQKRPTAEEEQENLARSLSSTIN